MHIPDVIFGFRVPIVFPFASFPDSLTFSFSCIGAGLRVSFIARINLRIFLLKVGHDCQAISVRIK